MEMEEKNETIVNRPKADASVSQGVTAEEAKALIRAALDKLASSYAPSIFMWHPLFFAQMALSIRALI